MKKYKIKYNQAGNIYVQYVEAENEVMARFLFYMEDMYRDIIELQEVEE